jgi:hypothetical protein
VLVHVETLHHRAFLEFRLEEGSMMHCLSPRGRRWGDGCITAYLELLLDFMGSEIAHMLLCGNDGLDLPEKQDEQDGSKASSPRRNHGFDFWMPDSAGPWTDGQCLGVQVREEGAIGGDLILSLTMPRSPKNFQTLLVFHPPAILHHRCYTSQKWVANCRRRRIARASPRCAASQNPRRRCSAIPLSLRTGTTFSSAESVFQG